MTENVSFAENVVKKAEAKGAKQSEVFQLKEKMTYITVEQGEIKFRERADITGLGLRVLKNGALGFSYTTNLNDSGIEKVIEQALSIASVMPRDADFKGFPESKRGSVVKDVYDSALANLSPEEAVEIVSKMAESARSSVKKVIPTFGVLDSRITTRIVANSMGIGIEEIGTLISIGLRTLFKSGKKAGNGYDFESTRKLKELHPVEVGSNAGELAVSSTKTKKIETIKTTVILEPHAVAGILEPVLAEALLGNLIQEKRSVFAGRMNQKIGRELLSVVDNGTLPGGFSSASFDDEGVPTQETVLIDRGVLLSQLYNTYYARKVGEESTGNAVRRGGYMSGSKPYRNPTTVGATNFIIKSGSSSKAKMIEETEDGVLVTFAVGGGSPISGDFSTDARNAFKIEHGAIAYPISQAMFTGNILQFGKNIVEISKEQKFSGGLSPGNLLCPVIKITDGLIIGT